MSVSTNALRTESLKKLFVSIAGRKKISVTIDRNCKVPYATSTGNITLPPPSAVDSEKFWMYAFHELGHLLKELRWTYTEMEKHLNLKDKLCMTVLNIIADNLCEKNFWGEYEGVDDALSLGRGALTKEYVEKDPLHYKAMEKDAVQSLMMGLVFKDALERQDWMGYPMECLPIKDCVDTHLPFIHTALDDIKFIKRLKAILGERDPARFTALLVYDILNIIGYEPPPPEPEGKGKGSGGEKKPCPSCSGTGKDADGKECETCKGEGSVTSDSGDTGSGEGKGTDTYMEAKRNHADGIGTGHESPGWTHDPNDMSSDVLAKVIEGIDERASLPIVDGGMIRDGREGSWSWSSSGPYVPWDEHKVIKVKNEEPHTHLRNSIVHALGDSTVSKAIAKYLKAMCSDTYTYGQRRGKLHQKNVHRVITGVPQPGRPPAIYKKKNQSLLKADSAVTLLLDCSGSMRGSKYAIGAACCVALSETLQGLGIQHEVLGFTESDSLITYILKEYGEPCSRDKMLNIMAQDTIRMSNNADGESLMYASERLMTRKETRKLLVVLSDGHPAGRFIGDGRAYLKKICKMIEDRTPIDLVGIGVETGCVSDFYKHNVVVHSSSQLDSVLFQVLKEFLVK
jgi:hypothetical protein